MKAETTEGFDGCGSPKGGPYTIAHGLFHEVP